MPSRKDSCPRCDGVKDKRAEMCKNCQSKYNHSRQGTGKGWRLHKKLGYIYKCVGSSNTTFQHRYVMEKHIGRKLTSKEAVHHKDGDRTNNELDNLELMSRSEHAKINMTPDVAKKMSVLGHKKRWGFEDVTAI